MEFLLPLKAVSLTMASLISGLESPTFSGEQKLELKDAYFSVRRLKRLTEDLTKYAEDVRFGRLNAQIFTLSVIHNQTQFDFQSQFQEKNLQFSAEYLPDSCADWQVYGDYYRISQVCNNFVQNAVKFTRPGGHIQLRIRARGKLEKSRPAGTNDRESSHSAGSMGQLPAQFTDDSSSGRFKEGLDWQVEYFEFEVEDNGIGIADEDLGKIFEPWHQLADDKTHNEVYGGIGLGLAICQFWVTKMDGKIEVQSRRASSVNERGSTIFKVLIPLRVNRLSRRNSTNSSKLSVRTSGSEGQSSGKSSGKLTKVPSPLHEIDPQALTEAITSLAPQSTLKASQKQSCRILIAEDEPINQRVVQRMLMKDGFRQIQFAQNGFQAIEAVSRAQEAGKQFNLILMDFQMPHVDGPLATTVIRRMPNITQDRLTIIALTAYDDDKSKRDCLSAGMNDFITKPISHAVLRETLVKHLSLPSVPEHDDEDDESPQIASPLPPASVASSAQENTPSTSNVEHGV
jgi:signal transduction histidine kinase/DNA-binding NarL/FixJ family response regulator